jgi:hypothetical protein
LIAGRAQTGDAASIRVGKSLVDGDCRALTDGDGGTELVEPCARAGSGARAQAPKTTSHRIWVGEFIFADGPSTGDDPRGFAETQDGQTGVRLVGNDLLRKATHKKKKLRKIGMSASCEDAVAVTPSGAVAFICPDHTGFQSQTAGGNLGSEALVLNERYRVNCSFLRAIGSSVVAATWIHYAVCMGVAGTDPRGSADTC